MKTKSKRTTRKASAARPLQGDCLISRFMMWTSLVWGVTAVGLLAIIHVVFIPISSSLFGTYEFTTHSLFLTLMAFVMIVLWLYAVARSKAMHLKPMSIAGIAVFIISTFLSCGFDYDLLNSFSLSPEVLARYDISRSYIFMLLEVTGLGLFIVPTGAGGGLKVLFALYPLTRFLDEMRPELPAVMPQDAGSVASYGDKLVLYITIACVVKIVYSLLLALLAWRWGRRAGKA